MKDLLVYTADADALATIRAVLNRPGGLGIRTLTFAVERYPLRDAGIVKDGPELTRRYKGQFGKAVLVWDHCGSGFDHRFTPDQSAQRIQNRLDTCTWQGASSAIVIVPELEEWLWHDTDALCRHWRIASNDLDAWVNEYCRRAKLTPADVREQRPKELFEHISLKKLRRTISPRDFEQIGGSAALDAWSASSSFEAFRTVLRTWFPI